jgi:hypothetical protein
MTAQHRPDLGNLLATVAAFLNELAPGLQGEARYHARVSVYLLEICQREFAGLAPVLVSVDEGALAASIRAGERDADWDAVLDEVLAATRARVLVTKPAHAA